MNGELRLVVGDPYRTALISTTVSTIFLFALSGLVMGRPVPDGSTFTHAVAGGCGSAVFSRDLRRGSGGAHHELGSAVLFFPLIFGQLLMAVMMDHFGGHRPGEAP